MPLIHFRATNNTKSPVKTSTPREAAKHCQEGQFGEFAEKILKESYFHRLDWARTFASGPLDPAQNMY